MYTTVNAMIIVIMIRRFLVYQKDEEDFERQGKKKM